MLLLVPKNPAPFTARHSAKPHAVPFTCWKTPIPIKRLILLENVVAISLLCPSTGKKWKSQGKGVDVYSFYTNMHYFYIAPIDRAAVTSWLLLPTQHSSLSISVLFWPVFAIAWWKESNSLSNYIVTIISGCLHNISGLSVCAVYPQL